MADWIAVIFVAAASLIIGRLFVSFFCESQGRFNGDRLTLYYASLAIGLIVVGWIAFVLAEIGWFTLTTLAVVWLSLTLFLLLILAWRRRSQSGIPTLKSEPPSDDKLPLLSFLPAWTEYFFLIAWLAAASWLFFRPHEFIIGGADAGVYVNLAANMSKTGSILIDDLTLDDLDPDLYSGFLRILPEHQQGTEVAPYYLFPGFYVTEAATGSVMPQFYPLHPVWQAAAFSLSGVDGALLITGFWALLGGLAVYLVIRELYGWEIAALGLTGLSLTALQIWFARYPTTEMLTQFLLWTAIWSTLLWLRGSRPGAFWAFLAGAALGEVLLVRIDTYFLLVIPVVLWIYLRRSRRWRLGDWWFFVSFGLLTLHSLLHARFQSTPYFYNTFGFGFDLARQNWLIPLLAALTGVVIVVFALRGDRYVSRLDQVKRPLLVVGVVLIIVLFIYGWFVRPIFADVEAGRDYWYAGGQFPTGLDQENLVRLGWYLSPLGILLAAAGICVMLWRANARTAVILIVGLIFSLLYLWRIQANPHQIYAMRRYVPTVLPFFVIATSSLFDWLVRQRRKWAAISGLVIALLWIASIAWNSRGFVSQVDYEGIVNQMDELDTKLDSGSILIFRDDNPVTMGDVLGTPLKYLYGHDVFSLRDVESIETAMLTNQVEEWREAGRTVYWIGDDTLVDDFGLAIIDTNTYSIDVQHLEASYAEKPYQILNANWILTIHEIRSEYE